MKDWLDILRALLARADYIGTSLQAEPASSAHRPLSRRMRGTLVTRFALDTCAGRDYKRPQYLRAQTDVCSPQPRFRSFNDGYERHLLGLLGKHLQRREELPL